MINSVRLIDFQSHKDNTLEFHPTFNIICGPSGNGKSSILRAIKYTVFNNPGVSEVRHPDATAYQIELTINGNKITRTKGVGVNSYQLNDEPVLTDVNRDVPDSIKQVLNISEISLDSNFDININFADQLDAPFVLNEKDQIKMKFLNVLSGTNAVDLASKRAVALSKENTREEKQLKEEIAAIEKELTSLTDQLAQLKKQNNYIKEQNKQLESLYSMRIPLTNLKEASDYLQSEYKKLKILTENLKNINIEQIESNIERFLSLSKLQVRYLRTKEDMQRVSAFEKQAELVDLNKIEEKIRKLLALTDAKTERDVLKSKYFSLNSAINDLNTKYAVVVGDYIKELNTARLCPICGSPITKQCIKEIEDSFK